MFWRSTYFIFNTTILNLKFSDSIHRQSQHSFLRQCWFLSDNSLTVEFYFVTMHQFRPKPWLNLVSLSGTRETSYPFISKNDTEINAGWTTAWVALISMRKIIAWKLNTSSHHHVINELCWSLYMLYCWSAEIHFQYILISDLPAQRTLYVLPLKVIREILYSFIASETFWSSRIVHWFELPRDDGSEKHNRA